MSSGSVSFCVGTGRCGTTFIAQLAGLEHEVAAWHERFRLAATFHMYCKWHGIAVDPEGFLIDRDAAVRADLEHHAASFESSALLSHSILELHQRFDARFLLLVRRPDHTVGSFAVRGWFLHRIPRADPTLPPSYREGEEPRHFLGRNIPHGPEFERWSALTQIGKLAWFWTARNRAILEQFRQLPHRSCRIERLEDLGYERYREVADFLGWRSTLDDTAFRRLATSRPNAGPNLPRLPSDWVPQEVAEFEGEVGSLAAALGYEHRVAALAGAADPRLSGVEDPPELDHVWLRLASGPT